LPTERFFNLDESKRMRIIGAAICELSRVPANEISINRIIKDAGISRGSFYQYFTDKNDLITHILGEFRVHMVSCFENHAEKSGNNVFTMAEKIFESAAAATDCADIDVIKNFFLSLKISNTSLCSLLKGFSLDPDYFREKLYEIAMHTGFICLENDFIEATVNMISLILGKNLADLYCDYSNAEIHKKSFYTQLDIIRRGTIKEN